MAKDVPNWTVGEDYTKLIGRIMAKIARAKDARDIVGYFQGIDILFDCTSFLFNEEEETKQVADFNGYFKAITYGEEKRNPMGQLVTTTYPQRTTKLWTELAAKSREMLRKVYEKGLLIPKKDIEEETDEPDW